MQGNAACQCVCLCIHVPLHTFRNHNGGYILKWKHQRTYLWPCSDTTLSVSQKWCWFIPVWGQRAEPLGIQSSRDGKKLAWGFSPLLLQVSSMDYFSLLPLILVGHGCGSHWRPVEGLCWQQTHPMKHKSGWIPSHNLFSLMKLDRKAQQRQLGLLLISCLSPGFVFPLP